MYSILLIDYKHIIATKLIDLDCKTSKNKNHILTYNHNLMLLFSRQIGTPG